MQVFDTLAPQKRAGHLQRLALELEEIKQDDGRDDQEKDQRQGAGKGQMVTELEILFEPIVDRTIGAERGSCDMGKNVSTARANVARAE